MKILFCTDGSEISYNALRNFSKWISGDCVVDIICVVDWSYIPDSMILEDSSFVSSCRNIADDILSYSAKILESTNLKLGKLIKLCGAAVESILETVESNTYNLVLMGSHGKKGIQRWLGSVSRDVLEESVIPVYISKNQNNSNRILFVTNETNCFINALNFVTEHLDLGEKDIYACAVIEDPELLFLNGTLDSAWRSAIDKRSHLYSKNTLKMLEDFLCSKNYNIHETKIIKGNPPTAILDYAKEKDIDLIVLVSQKGSKTNKFLKDTRNSRIVENTRSDTLVINL